MVAAIVVDAAFSLQISSVKVPLWDREWVKLDGTYWPLGLLPQLRTI
jgi:hypothetical protein